MNREKGADSGQGARRSPERDILRMIEERLNQQSEEAQLAEVGITGSEFFKQFNRQREEIERSGTDSQKQSMNPQSLGNKIEAYLNRQREQELEEFAFFEKKLSKS